MRTPTPPIKTKTGMETNTAGSNIMAIQAPIAINATPKTKPANSLSFWDTSTPRARAHSADSLTLKKNDDGTKTALWDEKKENLEEIEIPCHWNYDHMVQTKKDIVAVLNKLGITAKEIEMSY